MEQRTVFLKPGSICLAQTKEDLPNDQRQPFLEWTILEAEGLRLLGKVTYRSSIIREGLGPGSDFLEAEPEVGNQMCRTYWECL